MSDPHVLIVSTKVDPATDAVVQLLADKGVSYHRIDTEDYPFDRVMAYDPGEPGQLFEEGKRLPAPTSIWYRRMRTPSTPAAMDEGVANFCRQEARSFVIGSITGYESRWMSRPASVWQAEFKPYQLRVANRLGLRIPDTIISNDPSMIEDAFRRFRSMIVKPVRSGYLVKNGIEHSIFTSELLDEHLEDINDARWSPSIYQPLLPKKHDVRVTLVGGECFAVAIDSPSDPAARVDWRQTENPDLPHRSITLPEPLVASLRALLDELDLTYGAIDLVETVDGDYVFLEVNPNGQWLWLDDILQLGISEAVATWLGESVERY